MKLRSTWFSLLAALVLMLSSSLLQAQQDYTVGAGASTIGTTTGNTGQIPYSRWYSGWRTQYIYTAAVLNAAGITPGNFTAIAFNVASNTGADAMQNFTIKIGSTSQTACTATYINSGLTTVYANSNEPVPALGWNKYNFSTNFLWDGTSSVLVEICSQYNVGGNCANYTYNCPVKGDAAAYNSNTYYYTDGNCNMCTQATGTASNIMPQTRFSVLSGIESSFPDNVDPRRILTTSLYDGASGFPAPSLTFRRTSGTINLTYKITGPLPSTNVVYTALNSSTPTDTVIPITTGTGLLTQTFAYAKGSLAGVNGALDARSAVGGSYRVDATYNLPASGYTQSYSKQFIIAYQNDMSLASISYPRATPYKYLRGIDIPIAVSVQNVGLNRVNQFQLICTITNACNGGTIIRQDTINYNNATGLATGDTYFAQFANFNTINVSSYFVSFQVNMVGANDENMANNVLPSSGQCFQFDVQYATELSAEQIINPTGDVFVSRPIVIGARFKNNGAIDQSDIPTHMAIERWDGSQWVLVYQADKTIPDLAFTSPNTTILNYDAWTPLVVGQYRVCCSVLSPDDPVSSNNTVCYTFNVVDALSGTYTIGTLNSGSSRNFATIQAAVDAMYGRGVSGPVVFELTDNSYTEGQFTALNPGPALDLSSRILGINATNTVTFKPSLLNSLSRGSISIRLKSSLGIGVLYGQNTSPANVFAVQNQFKSANLYANSAGYITWDGGSQRSFRFQLDVPSTGAPVQRAVFYLGRGSSNIGVKNSLIENFPQATASYSSALPVVRYLSPNFTFEGDVRTLSSGPESYSAGIVSRSVVPNIGGNNSLGLDTLSNDNNQFVNNEISGFGFGVVSLGVGPLFYNDIAPGGNPRFQRYYNKNTNISNNIISSVSRAGIYCGYGENESIVGNRILNVGIGATGVSGQAAGIMIGGAARPGQVVYNNVKPFVAKNEVSNISSDVSVAGIYVEQTMNSFVNPTGGNISFPNANEAANVVGNIVYALNRTTQNASVAGIHLTTTRSQTLTGLTQMITPQVASYFSRGDSVINNTVMLTGDAVSNGNSMVGIGIQQGTNTVMMNNAIAVSAASSSVNTAAGNVMSGLFYQGTSPRASKAVPGIMPAVSGGLTSNRNAFWCPNAAVVRYIETDASSAILTLGTQSDYIALGQWKGWTAQDINSVVGNFTTDYVASTSSPSKLRVMTNPSPLGSILDRRGERISANLYDLDNDPRGLNGARFTIGADEFIGRLYVNDIEAIEVINPVSYRAGTGTFSDAEYIMTTAPVNVTARMRNNGSALQSGVTIQAQILDQNQNIVAANAKVVSIAPGESADITFDFNFSPMTYSDLGQSAPAPFTAMARNVTPVYTLKVFTPVDENAVNNQTAKPVRFYLMRSPIRMLNTTTSVTANANSSTTPFNDVVGRLNNDSLAKALSYVGLNLGNYDLFDRQGWEPRAVNYTMYRTLFFAGDTNRLTRLQRQDVRNFLAASVASDKKNLVVASQEILGKHIGLDATNDEQFVRNILRATNATTGALKGTAPTDRTPRAAGYDNQKIQGLALAAGIQETIAKTTNIYDNANPMPSLMKIYSDNQTNGLARTAYFFTTRDAGVTDSMMGIATNYLNYNVVFFGTDWRHLPRASTNSGSERIMRAIIEFIERSNGVVVPVELASFDAKRTGADVQINWTTASEKNLAYFQVERAQVNEKGNASFASVANVAAQGTSTVEKNYATLDLNVSSNSAWVYRLKSVDLDGSVNYSREVMINADHSDEAMTVSVSPNPVVTSALVSINLPSSGITEVSLVDLSGRTVQTIATGDMSGARSFNLTTSELASGTYTVVVKQNGAVMSQTIQIAK